MVSSTAWVTPYGSAAANIGFPCEFREIPETQPLLGGSTAWVSPCGSTATRRRLSMTIFSLAHTYALGFVVVICILAVGFIKQIMFAYPTRKVCSGKAISDVSHLLFSHAFHVLIVFLISQEPF